MSEFLPFGHDQASNYVNAMQQTLVMAAHDFSFKNGAFKSQITDTTPCLDAVRTLLASNLLSVEEKVPLQKLQQSVIAAMIRGSELTSQEVLFSLMPSHALTDMFEADARKRGQYVPPMLVQRLDKDNNVEASYEITSDGCKETKGGKHGQFPSAPAEFNRAQEEAMREFGIGKGTKTASSGNKRGATAAKSERDSTKTTPTAAKRNEDTSNSGDQAAIKKESNDGSKDQSGTDFGAVFKKNIRGAFS